MGRNRYVCPEHWQGSPEHKNDPELSKILPRLYDTFLAECWDYRSQIIPVKAGSEEGLHQVAEAGLQPEVDFVVLQDRKPLFAVECKSSEKQLDPAIGYFQKRTRIPGFYQVH